MTEVHRPGEYLEYRDAASAILSRESGVAALKAFGLTDLLDGTGPAQDLTPVYAFLEAQGFRVAASPALARLGLVGARLGLDGPPPEALLGWPVGADPWVGVPGLQVGAPVAVDRPGIGLLVVSGPGVRTRPARGPVADDYLSVVAIDPADADVVLGEQAVAPHRPAMLAHVRLGAAAEILGLVSRILDDAIGYVRLRRQFGRSLSSFQVVQHLLAWAAAERHQLEALYDVALDRLVRRGPDPVLAAAVKALAGRVLHAIAQAAIQVTGGIAFTWEYSLNRPHQRALALDQLAGSSADLVLALGRQVREQRAFPRPFGLTGPDADGTVTT
jgi:hypothetical protein